jgi:hypothetical protein
MATTEQYLMTLLDYISVGDQERKDRLPSLPT